MSIQLYPSIAKIKRNGVYENLPGFVPETGSIATQQMIATSESSATAQYVHNKGEYFRLNDTLYQAIVKINVGDAIVVGTNCEVAVIGNDLTHVANSIAAYELGIATSSHNTGDYFMVNETMYVATADIQVGDTISTSTNCRLAVVGDELSELKTAITQEFAWFQGTISASTGGADGITSTSSTKFTRIRTAGYHTPLAIRGYINVKSGYYCGVRKYDKSKTFIEASTFDVTSGYYNFDLASVYRFVARKTDDSAIKPDEEPITITYSIAYDSVVENNYYNRYERNPILQSKYSDSNRASLSFLHYSDIHASLYSMQDIQNFYNRNADLIDDIINTGDTVLDFAEYKAMGNAVSEFVPNASYSVNDFFTYAGYLYKVSNSFSEPIPKSNSVVYWGNTCSPYLLYKYFQMPFGEKSLYVLGNHDTAVAKYTGASTASYDYDGMTKSTAVSTYFSNISEWGVTRPSNDVCYYYKDYATQKIRLICLDVQYWDSTELSWLETALAGAKTAGYSVAIAAHCLPDAVTGYTDTNFTNYSEPDYSTNYGSFGNYSFGDAVSAIEDFISGGGEFICWLCGHNHRNRFAKCTNSTNITVVQIENAGNFNDTLHYNDRTDDSVYSRTCANVISFNTDDKLIRITRFGTNMDKYMRVSDYLCFDYANKQLIV